LLIFPFAGLEARIPPSRWEEKPYNVLHQESEGEVTQGEISVSTVVTELVLTLR